MRQTNQRGSGPIARSRLWEVLAFVVLLGMLNLSAKSAAAFMYLPDAVVAGEWWRLVTHPFVHVSRYHLLLDGAAFLLLYTSLREPSRAHRLVIVAASAAGSLWMAMLDGRVERLGFCGLSGVAHGLMAVTAVELIRDRQWIGWPCLAIVVGKAAWEAMTGEVAFAAWHMGSIGVPIAAAHLGGIMGAGLVVAAINVRGGNLEGRENVSRQQTCTTP